MTIKHTLIQLAEKAKTVPSLSIEDEKLFVLNWKQLNDQDTLERLYVNYAPLGLEISERKYASETNTLGYEDILSCALEGMHRGIDAYSRRSNDTFLLKRFISNGIRWSIAFDNKTLAADNALAPLREIFADNTHPMRGYDHNEDWDDEFDPESVNEYDRLINLNTKTPEEFVEEKMMTNFIAASCNRLTPRERDVFHLRFYGDTLTLDKTGEILGVTKERVRQLEGKALAKIRYALIEEIKPGQAAQFYQSTLTGRLERSEFYDL